MNLLSRPYKRQTSSIATSSIAPLTRERVNSTIDRVTTEAEQFNLLLRRVAMAKFINSRLDEETESIEGLTPVSCLRFA